LKAVYDHSNSDSSIDESSKVFYVMYGGSWNIMSQRVIKTLLRAVATAAPTTSAVPHHKWIETSIAFDASDCPQEHGGC
jgi:hypothetical protein